MPVRVKCEDFLVDEAASAPEILTTAQMSLQPDRTTGGG